MLNITNYIRIVRLFKGIYPKSEGDVLEQHSSQTSQFNSRKGTPCKALCVFGLPLNNELINLPLQVNKMVATMVTVILTGDSKRVKELRV